MKSSLVHRRIGSAQFKELLLSSFEIHGFLIVLGTVLEACHMHSCVSYIPACRLLLGAFRESFIAPVALLENFIH